MTKLSKLQRYRGKDKHQMSEKYVASMNATNYVPPPRPPFQSLDVKKVIDK